MSAGGMKRRLAVAMSAVGEVDAIFLDEPVSTDLHKAQCSTEYH